MKTWSITRMRNRALGKVVLIISWLILSLLFSLGLFVIVLSIREIIFGFKPGFFPYLFALIGFIMLYNSYKYSKTPYARDANTASIWIRSYLKSNKLSLGIAAVLTAILLYIYYTAFFLEFGFAADIILFLPAFILENLIFIQKGFLKKFIGASIPEAYGILIPIAEFYYIHTVVKFFGSLMRNFARSSNSKNIKIKQ